MSDKTNYRRLWRQAKERETALHNLNQEILTAIPKNFKDKKEVDAFMNYVTFLRSK